MRYNAYGTLLTVFLAALILLSLMGCFHMVLVFSSRKNPKIHIGIDHDSKYRYQQLIGS